MKILITGAGGFLGQQLAARLLDDSPHQLVLTDIVDFSIGKGPKHSGQASIIKTDLSTNPAIVVTNDLDAVFILHGIMSAGAEADYDLGLKVNLDSTRSLLDCLRQTKPGIRVVYASSLAVFGRPYPDYITEDTFPTPEGSYGCEKAMCEMLINDYTRRGFIDGFSLRLPGINIRPGKPSAAASSFQSGLIREPLAGKECVIPITDRSFACWVCSPKTMVENFIHALSLASEALPSHKRAINVPGLLVTIQEMRDALEKVGGKDRLRFIREEDDPKYGKMIHSWPARFDIKLALDLGFKPDTSFEQAVRDYVDFIHSL